MCADGDGNLNKNFSIIGHAQKSMTRGGWTVEDEQMVCHATIEFIRLRGVRQAYVCRGKTGQMCIGRGQYFSSSIWILKGRPLTVITKIALISYHNSFNKPLTLQQRKTLKNWKTKSLTYSLPYAGQYYANSCIHNCYTKHFKDLS